MPFEVFDYRVDVRNVVVTPTIRSRFLRMEPGAVTQRHSHDLGHEVFLVLEGQCEFEIDGERAVLGPGQMCVAYAHQMHQVRVVGDQPMTMYLSVTPHIEPTHTMWGPSGERLPPRYGTSNPDRAALARAGSPSVGDLADRQVAAAHELAETAGAAAEAQERHAAALKEALAVGDRTAAKAATDALWAETYRVFRRFDEWAAIWNDLAPRAGGGS